MPIEFMYDMFVCTTLSPERMYMCDDLTLFRTLCIDNWHTVLTVQYFGQDNPFDTRDQWEILQPPIAWEVCDWSPPKAPYTDAPPRRLLSTSFRVRQSAVESQRLVKTQKTLRQFRMEK